MVTRDQENRLRAWARVFFGAHIITGVGWKGKIEDSLIHLATLTACTKVMTSEHRV